MTKDAGAEQFETVERSRKAVDRAKAYEAQIADHLAGVNARIAAAGKSQVAAAIGTGEVDTQVDIAALRAEAAAVERQHRMAARALRGVEAEHARDQTDLAACFGSDDAARASLKEAQRVCAAASLAAREATGILDRAMAHAAATSEKLAEAQRVEREQDHVATARLQSALRSGAAIPATSSPLQRASVGLEEDARTAALTVDRLAVEHVAALANVGKVERVVAAAVDAVMAVDADALARELTATEARAGMLRRRLTTYTERTALSVAPTQLQPGPLKLNPGGWYDRPIGAVASMNVRQSTEVQKALRSAATLDEMMRQGPTAMNWTVEANAWSDYATALTADAAAAPGFVTRQPYQPALPRVSEAPVSSGVAVARVA